MKPLLLGNFKEAAAARNIRVIQDLGGICIARETEINGSIYFHAVELRDQDVLPANWDETFATLDRRFASLLAGEGHIPLPPQFSDLPGAKI